MTTAPGPRVLSVKQPWAWAIVSGLKHVENRSWATPYRGTIYIHASRQLDTSWRGSQNIRSTSQGSPDRMVIGKCDIVDIVDAAGRVSASASGSLVQKAGLLKTRDGWLVLLKNRDRDKKG